MKHLLTLLSLSLIAASSVRAEAPNRNIVVTGPNGQTATRQVTATPTGNGRMLQRVFTGPQGQSFTGSGTISRADGSRAAIRTVTGPQGASRTFNRVRPFRR